jgi:hypothetical protein
VSLKKVIVLLPVEGVYNQLALSISHSFVHLGGLISEEGIYYSCCFCAGRSPDDSKLLTIAVFSMISS